MKYRWAVSLVTLCAFGVAKSAAQDRPLITPPALADELCAAAKDGRIYGRVEGMVWFIRDAHTPPLVTYGNPNDPIPGALGQPGTTIAFGGNIDTGTHTGGQFTLGYWFDNSKEVGIEATAWFFNRRTTTFTASSDGVASSVAISRSFFDPNAGIENADIVSLPGLQAGATSQRLTDRLTGGEFNLLAGAAGDTWYHVGCIAGIRVLVLDEDLDMASFTQAVPPAPLTFDSNYETFHASNQYVGGQVGLDFAVREGGWVFDVRGTAGLGCNWEEVDINGTATHIDAETGTTKGPGGLFAQPTNIGNHQRGSFAFFGEIGASLSYWWTDWFNMRIGYRFLYLSSVVRAGDQIDRVVSIQPVGGGPILGVARPVFSFHETEFWADGVNFGCEIRF